MKNLRKKTFLTIFIIMSIFSISFAILFNIQIYYREYRQISTSITKMHSFLATKNDPFSRNIPLQDNEDLQNQKIIDYEIYTFILDRNDNIIYKISHSDNIVNDKILNIAKNILQKNKENKIKVGNLYLSSYAYNLKVGNFLTIVNISNIKKGLYVNLLLSIILICLGEIIIYIFTKKITDWITKPVLDSFNREKEFIANASHELKTPLAVMMASIDSLSINKKNEKWINNLKSESDRMNNLITRLLDLSKSENYLVNKNHKLNDLSLIVEKRALTFESLAFEKKVTINTKIEKDIKFLCHKESIDELISILIDNAISHSEKSSEIKIILIKNKSEVTLEVINKGPAIPDNDQEKIFERFYRNDESHNRKSNKYGLGLAIAKNIVDAHNGSIKAFSKNGYTTFKVVFKINEK